MEAAMERAELAAVRSGHPLCRPVGLRADQQRNVLRRRGFRLHAAGAAWPATRSSAHPGRGANCLWAHQDGTRRYWVAFAFDRPHRRSGLRHRPPPRQRPVSSAAD